MKVQMLSIAVLGCASALLVGPALPAQTESSSLEGDAARGKPLFEKNCAGCHGPQGKGDGYRLLGPDPANLTSALTREKSDDDLLETIHRGKQNMPAWKVILSDKQTKDVLAYVRTLAK
jgi:mono/diheme cytochrome c family protein